MVLANTSDGLTERFLLSDAEQSKTFFRLVASGKVTALSILHDGIRHSLPIPKRFKGRVVWGAGLIFDGLELLGECVYAQVESVRVTMTLLYASGCARCDLVRTGSMRYNPNS